MELNILSKDKLDEIDLKNAESNFIDALWDTAREQAKETVRQLLPLLENLLSFTEHGDYRNGNDFYGVDEGDIMAGELCEEYRQEIQELKELVGDKD